MASIRLTLLVLVLAACQAVAPAQDKVNDAIDTGIQYLLAQTESLLRELEGQFPGKVEPTQQGKVGPLTIQLYGLVVAGVSVENPVIRGSFEFLTRMQFSHTYTVALYIFALDAAISQLEDDLLMFQPANVQMRFKDDPNIGKEYRLRLQAAVDSFLKGRNKDGVWRYGPNPGGAGTEAFDNSNVQFAVLALGIGAKRRMPIDPDVWQKIVDHFVKGQQKDGPETKNRITLKPPEEAGKKRDEVKIVPKDGGDASKEKQKPKKRSDKKDQGKTVVAPPKESPEVGTEEFKVFERGWDYQNKGTATWNMTCAGLSSLLLARENLRGKLAPPAKAALDKAIWDGYGWLMGHWGFQGNYYGMYSLEKVGDIGGVDKFAGHDWYAEMSDFLIQGQQGDGSWPSGQWANDNAIATAYALLVLKRATTLLSMNRTSNIVISGRRAVAEEQADRSWVYVPDLDTTVHYPSLMTNIRLRPSAKLIKFLRNIIDNYDVTYKGELVPELAMARDAITNKTAKGIIEEYLIKITGYKYDDPEKYMAWYRRWEKVLQMGQSQNAKYKDALLRYYKATTKSIPLKKTIMWALFKCKVREAIPLLLEDLNNADAYIRLEAYKTFKEFFIDTPPPFDPNASQSVRDAQVAAIKDWYSKQAP